MILSLILLTLDTLLIQNNVECLSDDERLDSNESPLTLEECITACKNKVGCNFIISGTNNKTGECWMEKTQTEFCSEGWENDEYNFYMIESKGTYNDVTFFIVSGSF